MSRIAARALLSLGLLAGACSRPQWVLHLYTDARVPQFGDRLSIELLTADGSVVPAGQRLLSAAEQSAWPQTFGIAFDHAPAPLLVRARLYREDHTNEQGVPDPSFIDALGRLPASGPTAIEHLAMGLTLDCFGIKSVLTDAGNPATCDPRTAALGPVPLLQRIGEEQILPSPDSWGPGQPRPCPQGLRLSPDLACIPGGAFVLSGPDPKLLQESPERLVRVDPFIVQREEITVRQVAEIFRQFGEKLPTPPGPTCNYTGVMDEDLRNEFPMNCISYQFAVSLCSGAVLNVGDMEIRLRLPTSAEWEWMAGNQEAETSYPWGSDPNICEHSIISRAPFISELPSQSGVALNCRRVAGVNQPWGALPHGHPGDSTFLEVHNLAGNLQEPVADDFSLYTSACWTPQGRSWLENPVCREPSTALKFPGVRGASWQSIDSFAGVIHRSGLIEDPDPKKITLRDYLGVRCVASLAPPAMAKLATASLRSAEFRFAPAATPQEKSRLRAALNELLAP